MPAADPPPPGDLAARLAAEDAVRAFGLHIDRRDWAAYRRLFADEVEVDYRPRKPGIPTGPAPADAWAAGAAACFDRIPATQHAITVISTELNGDAATVLSNLAARHHDPGCVGGAVFTEFSRYEHALTLSPDGWKIAGVRCEVLFAEGNKAVLYDNLSD